ncbi:MAG: methylated-DNA--[protein]-cysteine S-methyltransferase [Rickettsiales bacterium]|nr:methylated-DNA--[protein]-cysteine S-methyltransferase [Rickettsiales bacterium]
MLQPVYYYKTIQSPVGQLRLIASERGLAAVLFHDGRRGKAQVAGDMVQNDEYPLLLKTEKQLAEYFAGKRKQFDIKLDANGTVFQQKAWRELVKIPYGQTINYGEQARRLGDSNKARAVGMANGRNPISIIVPCHRVIGASGDLTGFGGGVDVKQQLLELEQQFAA